MTPHGAHTYTALRRMARHDNRLTMTARVLFEDICDLAEETGVCRKRPESFATTYECGITRIKDALALLKVHGYMERRPLPSDGRRKGFAPTWPTQSNPEVREDAAGNPARVSDPVSASEPEIRPQLQSDSRPSPRLSPPRRGERGARAHTREGAPAVSASDHLGTEADRPAWAPTLDTVLARAGMSGIATDVAERFFWHYESTGWMTGGEHSKPIANWVGSLMSWKLKEPQFARRKTDTDRGDASAATAFLTGATS